jgi:hypothetical protein
VHNYSKNTKEKIGIFNRNGGLSIWWEYLKDVKGLKESKLTWKRFKKYFRKPYLSKKHYVGKIKEFHKHKLGQLTMDFYAKRFLYLLRYVPYLKDEKEILHHFLNGLP